MKRSHVMAPLMLAALAAGCGGVGETAEELEDSVAQGTDEAFSEACGQAVEEAAAIGDMEDTVEDLDGAIAACLDLDELGAAIGQFPAALDGADLETFVSNRCQYSEDQTVVESAICAEIAG